MVDAFVPTGERIHAQVSDDTHDLVPRSRLEVRGNDVSYALTDGVPLIEDVLDEGGVHDDGGGVLAGAPGQIRRVELAPAQDVLFQSLEEVHIDGGDPDAMPLGLRVSVVPLDLHAYGGMVHAWESASHRDASYTGLGRDAVPQVRDHLRHAFADLRSRGARLRRAGARSGDAQLDQEILVGVDLAGRRPVRHQRVTSVYPLP
jgi:hypothetical protein